MVISPPEKSKKEAINSASGVLDLLVEALKNVLSTRSVLKM
ncbi:hypothetical protein Hanom_Chr15g01380201 [Helianthus anomalus]